jgi:pimeloyl-ACP methyl ester carboxylesterase
VRSERVPVAEGVSLRVLRWEGGPTGEVPFLLVHGLASNALLWQGVADGLARLGHDVVAVDQRGHGRSDRPAHGYDMDTACADLVGVIEATGLDRPAAAGQSWGGNVVLEVAARHPGRLRGVACVDGGWIELADRFADWDACRGALQPPPLEGRRAADIEAYMRSTHPDWPEEGIAATMANFEVRADGTVAPWLTFDRHIALLQALWEHRPSTRYADVAVPVLLMPASGRRGTAPGRDPVARAEAALTRARTHRFDADHDIHAQRPGEVAEVLHRAAADGFFA